MPKLRDPKPDFVVDRSLRPLTTALLAVLGVAFLLGCALALFN